MAEKISDNMGKKIVEALKMQNPDYSTVNNDVENPEPKQNADNSTQINNTQNNDFKFETTVPENNLNNLYNTSTMSDIESAFQNSINSNLAINAFDSAQTDVEYPNNVVILNHLISKLPSGVSKQTGAVIIRQTMEALGISMKSVIQEARQVQETLSNKAKDCQRNILEYKKQIADLETKSRRYQRQSVVMNDTINLFINTGV